MSRVVLDTSVFIAREQARPLATLPAGSEVAVSVVTLAELRLGVLVASETASRSLRLATYEAASAFEPLPIDAAVADRFADLAALGLASGRKVKLQDAWIAATALAHGASVATQDSDFDEFDGLIVLRV